MLAITITDKTAAKAIFSPLLALGIGGSGAGASGIWRIISGRSLPQWRQTVASGLTNSAQCGHFGRFPLESAAISQKMNHSTRVAFCLFALHTQRQSDMNIAMTSSQHLYEVRPRKDRRGVDLISDALPFGRPEAEALQAPE